jgi:hypothetical protein
MQRRLFRHVVIISTILPTISLKHLYFVATTPEQRKTPNSQALRLRHAILKLNRKSACAD